MDVDGHGGPLTDGGARVSATFPSSFALALGYEQERALALEASVIFTRWENFDYLTFDYSDTLIPDNEDEFFYKNTWRFQVGGEYYLTDTVAVRAGFVYDQTPTRHDYASPMLPANDRMLYSFGLGYKGQQWHFDFAGMYIHTKERVGMDKDVTGEGPDGTYTFNFRNGETYILGISGGYAF